MLLLMSVAYAGELPEYDWLDEDTIQAATSLVPVEEATPDGVSVSWGWDEVTLHMHLENDRQDALVLDWSTAAFVFPDGSSSGVVPGETLTVDVSRDVAPPATVPSGASVDKILIVRDAVDDGDLMPLVRYTDYGEEAKVSLPLEFGEQNVRFEQRFRVEVDTDHLGREEAWEAWNRPARELEKRRRAGSSTAAGGWATAGLLVAVGGLYTALPIEDDNGDTIPLDDRLVAGGVTAGLGVLIGVPLIAIGSSNAKRASDELDALGPAPATD